ncbi:MAG: hypothetical protein J6Y13_11555 [Treponema sp.]|nr:hypothetical protein [Treponema sp.]
MAQFYFLSVLFNILVGLILMYGRDLTAFSSDAGEEDGNLPAVDSFDAADEGDFADNDSFADFGGDGDSSSESLSSTGTSAAKASLENFSLFNNKAFRLVTGVLSMFVAVIKLLSPMDIPFIGDFVPAFAGLLGGFAFLVEYYEAASEGSSLNETVQAIFIDSRKYLGLICLAAGVLHFLLPKVILL